MKNLILLALLFPLYSQSQVVKFPFQDGQVYYDTVFNYSLNKNDLYSKVKLWSASIFNSEKNVIQTDDKELGLIVFKYKTELIAKVSPRGLLRIDGIPIDLFSTLKVFIKDNKIRVVITSLTYNMYSQLNGKELAIVGDNVLEKTIYLDSIGAYKKNPNYKGDVYLSNKKEDVESILKTIDNSVRSTIASIDTYILSNKKSEFDF